MTEKEQKNDIVEILKKKRVASEKQRKHLLKASINCEPKTQSR
jgi:hypothetical protein